MHRTSPQDTTVGILSVASTIGHVAPVDRAFSLNRT